LSTDGLGRFYANMPSLATILSMVSTDVELPCPACFYDLRGLEDGQCPECGAPFRAQNLKPEQPGLALENWLGEATTKRAVALFALRIARSPRKAFRRQCRLEKVLDVSPFRVVPWMLGWFLLLVIGILGIWYCVLGFYGTYPGGGYWSNIVGQRLGPPLFAPIDVVIVWLQCLLIVLIAMGLGYRRLSARQATYLATWLLPIALTACLVATACDLVWHLFISNLLDRWLFSTGSEVALRISLIGNDLVPRSADLTLGLLGGIATATVVRRRAWVITIAVVVALWFCFPASLHIRAAFRDNVCDPICSALGVRMDNGLVRATLLAGPTFTPGSADEVLAGQWELRYETEEPSERCVLDFDSTGSLTRYVQHDPASGISASSITDGQTHETTFRKPDGDEVDATYVVLSASRRSGSHVTLHLRFEFTIEQQHGAITNFIELITEEHLSGWLNAGEDEITGTSVLRNECPFVNFDPAELERPFVMTVVAPASGEELPTDQ